jgi:hypothetical protein
VLSAIEASTVRLLEAGAGFGGVQKMELGMKLRPLW